MIITGFQDMVRAGGIAEFEQGDGAKPDKSSGFRSALIRLMVASVRIQHLPEPAPDEEPHHLALLARQDKRDLLTRAKRCDVVLSSLSWWTAPLAAPYQPMVRRALGQGDIVEFVSIHL